MSFAVASSPRACAPPCSSRCSWWVLSKGAPEAVQRLLGVVPPHYEACYKVSEFVWAGEGRLRLRLWLQLRCIYAGDREVCAGPVAPITHR